MRIVFLLLSPKIFRLHWLGKWVLLMHTILTKKWLRRSIVIIRIRMRRSFSVYDWNINRPSPSFCLERIPFILFTRRTEGLLFGRKSSLHFFNIQLHINNFIRQPLTFLHRPFLNTKRPWFYRLLLALKQRLILL